MACFASEVRFNIRRALEIDAMPRTFADAALELQTVFGTENVAPLLYSLVKFCRPRTALEVGAGLSTMYILRALKENVEEDRLERTSNRNVYGKTDYYKDEYRPSLLTLDDLSHKKSAARAVRAIAADLQLDNYLTLENTDFKGFSGRIPQRFLPLDFVWFDCGGLEEYIDFVNEYWHLINPAGGILILHSTQTNLALRLFVARLAERHAASADFEMLNLLEPHKKLQNSLSVLRMKSKLVTPIYTYAP